MTKALRARPGGRSRGGCEPVSCAHGGRGELLRSPRFETLQPERPVEIYLPPGYTTGGRLPVLYLHDGQNLFDEATAFAGSWKAAPALDRLADAGGPVVAVAIPNAGSRRIHEYAPVVDRRYGGGGGLAYLAWIAGELKPWIDRRFRVSRQRAETGIAGASMGGLISLYAFARLPEIFGVVGAMSPSLFFADEALTRWIERRPLAGGRIYLDIGTLEGRRNRRRKTPPKSPSGAMRRLRRLRRILEKKGFGREQDLLWIEEPGARHDEIAWSRRLPGMLDFLFAG